MTQQLDHLTILRCLVSSLVRFRDSGSCVCSGTFPDTPGVYLAAMTPAINCTEIEQMPFRLERDGQLRHLGCGLLEVTPSRRPRYACTTTFIIADRARTRQGGRPSTRDARISLFPDVHLSHPARALPSRRPTIIQRSPETLSRALVSRRSGRLDGPVPSCARIVDGALLALEHGVHSQAMTHVALQRDENGKERGKVIGLAKMYSQQCKLLPYLPVI